MEKGHYGQYTGNARHSRKEEMIHDRELISDAKKQLHRADQDYKSDSPAQMNAKKGTNPIYNLSGKKGLQPSNNPAAAYMTGSPVKHKMGGTSGGEVKHSHNETNNSSGKKGFFGQDSGTGIYGPGSFFEPKYMKDRREAVQVKTSKNNNNFVPDNFGEGSETDNSKTSNIGVKSNDGGATPAVKTPPKRKQDQTASTIKISGVSKSSGATGKEDKGTTIKETSKITSKKSTPPSAKITKAQIKANKADNKESGMSKRQIRLEKTKLKAANARYETTSDKTKAIGGKEGQRKAAKTKRLEKRASRIEGRIKRKADKKANK
jgi:hypothetical protein